MVNKLKNFNKDRKESLEVDSHTLIVLNFLILFYFKTLRQQQHIDSIKANKV